MKTLKSVDEETYTRIGKAYQICSEYPEVFGDVKLEKFCSMFVDVIDEGDDEREARMKAYAHDMYEKLNLAVESLRKHRFDSPTAELIESLLDKIDGGEASNE